MNRILVPTDFSETSENALNYAAEMASSFSASIILLNVVTIPVSTPEFGLSAYNYNEIKQKCLEQLQKMSETIKANYPLITNVECYAEIGNSSDLIVEFGNTKEIDLVIMGNSGHGSSFKKTFMGSTSVAVCKDVDTPLIIVPPNVTYKKINTIAYSCEYDPKIEGSNALLKVRNLCSLFNSELSVIHILPEHHLMSELETTIDGVIETKLESTSHKTYIIVENNVSEGLIDFITIHNIDMIIMEPKKHSLLHSLFNPSITNEIAFLSPIPVLTIHS